MQELDAWLIYTNILENLGLEYFVTGSVASIVYGEPRMTHDIDLVLKLSESDIDRFVEAFPSNEYYIPPKETLHIEIRRQQRGHFNLISHSTGFKADVYLLSNNPLHQWALQNRRFIALDNERQLWLAPPEYVILRKMEFYREGGSEKHVRDIQGMLEISSDLVDRELLEQWIARLGLESVWSRVSQHMICRFVICIHLH